MAEFSEENQKMLIRLESKVDNIICTLDSLASLEKRVRDMERDCTGRDVKIQNLQKDVVDLENKSNVWSVLNSIGVAIATLISIIFGSR